MSAKATLALALVCSLVKCKEELSAPLSWGKSQCTAPRHVSVTSILQDSQNHVKMTATTSHLVAPILPSQRRAHLPMYRW